MINGINEDKSLPNARGMAAAARMVETFRKTTKSPGGGLGFGSVVSVNPLRISVDNRLTVGEDHIILSPFCVETKINLKHSHTASSSSSGPQETDSAFQESDKIKLISGEDISLKHKHNLPASSLNIEPAFSEPVTLWKGLAVGDSVLLIKSNDGQLYYVLQKAGGIK